MHKPFFTPGMHVAQVELDALRIRGGLLLLVGPPGTGKTTLLERYQDSRPPAAWTGPVWLYRTEVVSTPLGLLQTLLAGLGSPWRGDTRDALRVLCAEMPPGAMLLVDDAHRLALPAMECLRRLHEQSGLRLVLCGAPSLPTVLRKKCLPLAHRVHGRLTLTEVAPEDVARFVHSQVRRADAPLSDTLQAATGGNLYWMHEGLRLARLEAQAHHRRLSAAMVAGVLDRRTA